MRVIGIILLVIGGLNVLLNIIGLSTVPEYADQQSRLLLFGLAMLGGGIYLLNRVKSKKQEQEGKDKWSGK